MSAKNYIPERGDVVWLNFTLQAGREQAGKRPALIISPKIYNEKSGLAIACPITTHIKGYPFEVLLNSNGFTHGAVLADHVKSVDWKVRKAKFVERCTNTVLDEVISKLSALLLSL